jgi:hypothetical protein
MTGSLPPSMTKRNIPALVLAVLLATVAAGCGATKKPPSNRTAAGVRARLYAFYKDERTGNTAAACAMATKANQAELMREEKVSSCQAAFFKIWNTTAGVFSEAREAKIGATALRRDESEVAKAKILVVGDHATVIDPGREETAEYIYRGGQWLFVKQESTTAATAAGLRKEAEESEAKNQAAIEAGEARGNGNEIKESGEEAG